ncbi:hypothetical protein ACQKNX_24505 [Lysinibacillus sp. NPDC093712]|uniref:hypothetical protein n=1 Tax=Lysinibacillus sp. NPDC093712 TaxID=3390579 RepID=UPI003D040C27
MNTDYIAEGNVVVHRLIGYIGICEVSNEGVSVHYGNMSGRYGRTTNEPTIVVAQYWRLATDEEVRHYFDAD